MLIMISIGHYLDDLDDGVISIDKHDKTSR